MTASLPTADERARKMQSTLLRALAPSGTQAAIAVAYGVSESTVTRWKDGIESVCRLAACAGFKLVPAEMHCYRAEDIEPYIAIAKQHLLRLKGADELIWDEDAP